MADHLTVDVDPDATTNKIYRIKDEVTGEYRSKFFYWKTSAIKWLSDVRAQAKRVRPDNPDSFTRWWFGFSLLREHDRGSDGVNPDLAEKFETNSERASPFD